jgi:hypothetical protein
MMTFCQAHSAQEIVASCAKCYYSIRVSETRVMGRSVRMRLTDSEIDCLLAEYPGLPVDYLSYLREIGWGEATSGHMIYSGPVPLTDV